MLQKFKITFYALIVLLVLVLPSQADAVEIYADSCKGWDCSYEGQICPKGAAGARDKSFVCTNSKWVEINCGKKGVDVTRAFGAADKCFSRCLKRAREGVNYRGRIVYPVREEQCLEMCDAQLYVQSQCVINRDGGWRNLCTLHRVDNQLRCQ